MKDLGEMAASVICRSADRKASWDQMIKTLREDAPALIKQVFG
jgi:hypothetical protein